MTTKYIQWPLNISNGRQIDQMVLKIHHDFPLQDPPIFNKIGIFCLKTNHLATLA
jgi:hypothetical protein